MAFLNWLIKTYILNSGDGVFTTRVSLRHTTMFTYSHVTTSLGQLEHAHYFFSLFFDDKLRVKKWNRITFKLNQTKLIAFFGCFLLCQRFRKFRSEFKWKGLFRFLPTGIFGITSGGGPLISVEIFRSKFAVPFLTNRFFALIREFGNDKKWQELFLLVGAG